MNKLLGGVVHFVEKEHSQQRRYIRPETHTKQTSKIDRDNKERSNSGVHSKPRTASCVITRRDV